MSKLSISGEDLAFAVQGIRGQEDLIGLEDLIGFGAEEIGTLIFGEQGEDAPEVLLGNEARAILAKRAGAETATVVRRRLRRLRRQILQYERVTIANAATGTATTQPQQLFKPKRLVISPTADLVTVADIKVANKSQFVGSTGNVPSGLFDASTADSKLSFLTANPGQDVSVEIVNGTTLTATYSVAFWGLVADT